MSDEDPRLFEPDSAPAKRRASKPVGPPERPRLASVQPPPLDAQVRLAADGAGVTTASDGLPAGVVKDHSAEKSWAVSRDLDTVGRAMVRQWFPVHYLELYSGPGVLVNERTQEETVGSPLEALLIKRPFDRYVFSDLNPTFAGALESRLRDPSMGEQVAQAETHARCGDANDPAHLEQVCSLIDRERWSSPTWTPLARTCTGARSSSWPAGSSASTCSSTCRSAPSTARCPLGTPTGHGGCSTTPTRCGF